MTIKEYIKKEILLMDGAMGTYFSELSDSRYTLSETANIDKPELIQKIHEAYIQAGARLIRTNTYSANPCRLQKGFSEVTKIIKAGIDIANRAVEGTECSVAYSIGPISDAYDLDVDKIEVTYRKIIDIGILKGVKIILFETFSNIEQVQGLVDYIKEQAPNIQIMTNFTVNQYGYTKVGVNKDKVIEKTKEQHKVASYGFNCGIGASHLLSLIKTMDFDPSLMAAVPNAGYPAQQLERTVYQNNADFFADTMIKICEEGVRIIGGCCGTTPEHIRKIRERLDKKDFSKIKIVKRDPKKQNKQSALKNSFREKLQRDEFVIAVELDPPFKLDLDKLLSAAHLLKEVGVDAITLADSPLGRARADSLLMGVKIKQTVGIDVLPHICLRDRNIIALRAGLVGAHISDIRNVLIVTGDPIASEDRSEIKSVFNMNATSFMAYIKEMNEELGEDGFHVGGALNPYSQNIDITIKKVKRKIEAGAKYLMTQPVYDEIGIHNIARIREETGIKIIGGILPLVSLRNAQFLNYEFPGITIPSGVMQQFNENMTREEAEAIGVKVAIELANKMRNSVDGFYFMTPFNRGTMIAKIIKGMA